MWLMLNDRRSFTVRVSGGLALGGLRGVLISCSVWLLSQNDKRFDIVTSKRCVPVIVSFHLRRLFSITSLLWFGYFWYIWQRTREVFSSRRYGGSGIIKRLTKRPLTAHTGSGSSPEKVMPPFYVLQFYRSCCTRVVSVYLCGASRISMCIFADFSW